MYNGDHQNTKWSLVYALGRKFEKYDVVKEYMICLAVNSLKTNSKMSKRDHWATRKLEYNVPQGLNGPIIALEIQNIISNEFGKKQFSKLKQFGTKVGFKFLSMNNLGEIMGIYEKSKICKDVLSLPRLMR